MPDFRQSQSVRNGDLTVAGDLTVQGVTNTIESSTLTIDDKNIEIASVVAINGMSTTTNLVQGQTDVIVESTTGLIPGMTLTKASGAGAFNAGGATIAEITNSTTFVASAAHATAGAITFNVGGATAATADGGGITLKGSTDKTILWENDTDSWDFSEHVTTADGKHILTDKIKARDGDGLHLVDDADNGIFIEDGGMVGVGKKNYQTQFGKIMQKLIGIQQQKK